MGPRVREDDDGGECNDRDVRLIAVCGKLTYQPIDGLYLPPIDIDVS
jgi:hypothetical protein